MLQGQNWLAEFNKVLYDSEVSPQVCIFLIRQQTGHFFPPSYIHVYSSERENITLEICP